jgi:hypothetical protein
MFFSGTVYAGGFKQWLASGRNVKKGAKAIYILVSLIYKQKDENDEKLAVLSRFKAATVFRAEDTEDEPLDYENYELPALPLFKRAGDWGIQVKTIPGNYQYCGHKFCLHNFSNTLLVDCSGKTAQKAAKYALAVLVRGLEIVIGDCFTSQGKELIGSMSSKICRRFFGMIDQNTD